MNIVTTILNAPVQLSCGAVLPNRLAKASMTEGLADRNGVPTAELVRLYGIWAQGGAGMLLTGNVQIDKDHLERPGNVVIDRPPNAAMQSALKSWAQAGTSGCNHLWMQINHAGRQTPKIVNPTPKAPSAFGVHLPGGQFGKPIALQDEEIIELVDRFVIAAVAAQGAGFTGVQIHAAHGYLLSQFLSPLTNNRQDRWGGSLENRARFLRMVVHKARTELGSDFPISVKLNSADFQRGGFAFEDSLQVARWLEEDSVDLLEISGGSYEQPAMMDMVGLDARDDSSVANIPKSTAAREAYFVDFARAMRAQCSRMQLMVTGGFRSRAAMEHAINSNAAEVVGLGRPLCGDPDACAQILQGGDAVPRYETQLALLPQWLRWLEKIDMIRGISGFAVIYWYYAQIDHLGHTGKPKLGQSVFSAMRQVMRQQREWVKKGK